MGTAKTRTALKNQSDSTFPTGTEEIVAVEHRQFNEDSDASALNLVDPAAQIITSKVDFLKQISSIGGLGKLTSFAESIKADMQGVVPDLAQTGAWNFVKDPSVVDNEGLKNGLTFLFVANGDAINFSVDFDVTSDGIVAGGTYIFSASWRGTKFSVNITKVGFRDYYDFEPQAVEPAHQIGRIFYDEAEHTHTAYSDLEGTSLQIGEELRGRLTNDTGATLADGVAVAVTGAIGGNLAVDLLDASQIDSSIRAIGLVTLEALPGADSYVVRFGEVRNLNTFTFTPGEVIYADPATPGGLTNVRPSAPNYPVRIGVCLVSHATLGVLGVDTLAFNGSDTTVNIEGTLNGVVVETPLVEFYESVGVIYAEVTNQNMPAQDLAFILDGVRYLLNTTTGGGPNGGAFAALVPGADAETLFENFIYVWLNVGTPELKVGTLATPDTLAPIGKVSLFDVTRTLAEGVYKWRRYNDAPDNAVGDGFNRWLADAVRDKLGTTYESGIDATVVVNSTPSVTIATTAGVAKQAHNSAFELQDGTQYWIYNDATNDATYESVSDLASIIETALGVSLAVNGAYYRLPVYGMQNSISGGALSVSDKLLVTRPLGFYSTAAEALTDAANLDVAPNDIITEGVLFKLYTLVIGRTGGGGAIWTLISTLDDRTRLIGGVGGGGAAGAAGTDDKVRVSPTDTTNSHLDDKLTVSPRLTKTIVNPGANEQINLDAVVHAYGIIYYDPANGLDTKDGSENFPVKTLQKAIDLHELGGGEEIRCKTYVSSEVTEALKSTSSTLIISGQKREYDTDVSSRETTITNIKSSSGRIIFKDVKVQTLSILQTGVARVDIEGVRTKITSLSEIIADKQYTSVELYDNSEIDPAGTINTPISIQDGGKVQIGVVANLDNVTIGLNSALVCLLPAQANTIATLTIDRGQIAMLASAVLEITTTFDHTGAKFVNREQITVTGTQPSVTGEFADTPNKLDKVKTDPQTINSNIAVVGETISFTATPTFDFDVKGNVKKMILTANVTTLTIANELPSGSYRVYLTENGTGGYTIPTPDSSWGTELDNSAAFETGATAVNLIDIAVDPDGIKFFSVNVKP